MSISNSVLITSNGTELAVSGASTGTANDKALLVAGSDGTTNRLITLDSSGRQLVVGAGTAGTPAGGVITIQGVSGGVVVPISAASLPLPTGAATETTLATLLTSATFTGRINTLGQKTMANSTPIVISSDQTVIPVSDNGSSLTVDNAALSVVGGGVESTALRVTIANDSTGVVSVDDNGGSLTVDGTVTANQGTANSLANAWSMKITDATNGPVAVKAASTAPVASDQALVVVLSPNQPAIPTTNAPSTSVPNVSTGDIILSSVTTAAIRRTTYTEQATNFTGSIASANANDTAAGTGARTVKIYYVDQTGATAGTETATLNGTTGVNLVTTTKCFIEKIEVLTAGSGGVNAGIISLYTGANKTGTVVGTIAATDNTTFWAHHYVVTGSVCSVTGVYHGNNSTVSGGVSVAVLKAKQLNSANAVERQVSDFIGVAGAANPFTRIYGSVIQVTGPIRLLMYVTSGSAASITYRGSFDSYDV
jgi:hypothetical protein